MFFGLGTNIPEFSINVRFVPKADIRPESVPVNTPLITAECTEPRRPQVLSSQDAAPFGPDWIHEIKHDIFASSVL